MQSAPAPAPKQQQEEEFQCSITTEPLTSANARVIKCGHVFSEEGIKGWFGQGKDKCPTCNQKANDAPRYRIYPMDGWVESAKKQEAKIEEQKSQIAVLQAKLAELEQRVNHQNTLLQLGATLKKVNKKTFLLMKQSMPYNKT